MGEIMKYLFGLYGAIHILLLLVFVFICYYILKNRDMMLKRLKTKTLLTKRQFNIISFNYVLTVALYLFVVVITKQYRTLVHYRSIVMLSLLLGVVLRKQYFFIFSFFSTPMLFLDIVYPSSLLTNYFVLNTTIAINIFVILLAITFMYHYKMDIKREEFAGVYVAAIFIFLIFYCISMGTAYDIVGIYKPTGNLRHFYFIYEYDRVLYHFVYIGTLGLLTYSSMFFYKILTKSQFISEYDITSIYY